MKQFLRGLSAVTAVNVLNGVLGVLIVPVAVARLGVEGYGLYSIFPLIAGYLVLVELGLGKNLIRLLGSAGSDADTRDLLRLALGLYCMIALCLLLLAPLLLLGVATVLFPVPAEHARTLHLITTIAVADYIIGIPVSLRLNYALSRERISDYARVMLVSHTSRYALMLAGVLLTTRVEVAVAFVLGRRLVDLAVAPRLLPPLPAGSWRPRAEWPASRRLVGQSSMLALSQWLHLSLVAAGSVLVNAFFGLAALGVYRSIFDIASKVWFFSTTAGVVLFPRLIQLLRHKDSRARLGRLLPGVQCASWLSYCVLAGAGVLVAPLALELVRLSAAPPLLFGLLLAGVLWNAHAMLSIEVLQADGRFRPVAEAAAVSLITMVALFLLLADRVPGLAIGWAWLASQFLGSALVDVFAMRPFHAASPRGVAGAVGRVLLSRVPGAILVGATLAWLGGLPWTLVAAAGAAALLLGARELPLIRTAVLDVSGRRAVPAGT